MDIGDLRRDYSPEEPLRQREASEDPVEQFRSWFADAQKSEIVEPNAMILATASASGRPSSRTVLLKHYDEDGFTFYTNLGSRKSRELKENAQASMTFLWLPLSRQVHVEGQTSLLPKSEAEVYFSRRPRGNQIGAWASQQDEELSSYLQLRDAYKYYEQKFQGKEVPMPSYWGGFRLVPDRYEFWQGRPSRLHDRLVYTHDQGSWSRQRLMP